MTVGTLSYDPLLVTLIATTPYRGSYAVHVGPPPPEINTSGGAAYPLPGEVMYTDVTTPFSTIAVPHAPDPPGVAAFGQNWTVGTLEYGAIPAGVETETEPTPVESMSPTAFGSVIPDSLSTTPRPATRMYVFPLICGE